MKGRKSEEERIDKIVIPGDKVGITEELEPLENVYTHRGNLFSSTIGTIDVDVENKRISVRGLTEVNIPRKDMRVYAQIVHVDQKYAVCKIIRDDKRKLRRTFTAFLLISDVSSKHIPDMFYAVRQNDIIYARVLSNKMPPFSISTRGKPFGVVLAYCQNCAMYMKKKRGNEVQCPICKTIEKRKLSINYGKIPVDVILRKD